MKTAISIIVTLFIANASFAQLTPGSYVVGGGLGFGYSNTPSTSTEMSSISFSITPSIGKFISEKYLMEVGLGYSMFSRTSSQPQTGYTYKQNGYSFYARFGMTRFFPIVDRLYFTFGGSIAPSFSKSNGENTSPGNTSTSESSVIGSSIGLAPGLTYFLNKKWMLYTSVGLLNYKLNYNLDSEKVSHNVYLSAQANSFSVGVRYVLGKGTKD